MTTKLQFVCQSFFVGALGVDMAPGCDARMCVFKNILTYYHTAVFVRFPIWGKGAFVNVPGDALGVIL